jgi:hypothetical protein
MVDLLEWNDTLPAAYVASKPAEGSTLRTSSSSFLFGNLLSSGALGSGGGVLVPSGLKC